MILQTVYKAGNSDVISIPVNIKKLTGITTGTDIMISVSDDQKTILINKAGDVPSTKVNPEFYSWLNKFNQKYNTSLQTLADEK
jgi:bifunctional DNA-binding transcriptional regulator/antitoxin component of YhaV-PrlF toxin-antitoxin module